MRKLVCTMSRKTAHALSVFSFLAFLICSLCLNAQAKVTRLEITRRADWLSGRSLGAAGSYEMLAGRAYYEIDPLNPANVKITDLAYAPRNAQGRVEFSGDFLVLRPKDPAKARGTVLFEVANRGGTQMSGLMFRPQTGQRFDLLNPSLVSDLDDAFIFDQGFTLVWAGWQFDVPEGKGIRLSVPMAEVSGNVRATYLAENEKEIARSFPLKQAGGYCAADPDQSDAILSVRSHFESSARVVPRHEWKFARDTNGKDNLAEATPDPCYLTLSKKLEPKQLYEVVYRATGSPLAGLGFAAVRDFSAYLKYGGLKVITLREHPETLRTILGYGYSQSARFLRNFLYDNFNTDKSGHNVFDGLFVAAAGAGRGDFNHRFAIPGEAGNSVLSILRPVDLFPFTDLIEADQITHAKDGLLVQAARSHSLPKIFYTYSSTEYWARVGSLAHTSVDGARDLPLHPQARLYFITGTPHAPGPFPPVRSRNDESFAYPANPSSPRFAFRALLLDLEEWVQKDVAPPLSIYPTLNKRELVRLEAVRFPEWSGFEGPHYMPRNWRMNYGANFSRNGIATLARPIIGAPYAVLVPQVDADGNERGGLHLPAIDVPLATYTGWNYTTPRLENLNYLSGLTGSFIPFARTAEERTKNHDPRLSITERYGTRDNYLARVRASAESLVKQRFVRREDIKEIVQRSGLLWDYVMQEPHN